MQFSHVEHWNRRRKEKKPKMEKKEGFFACSYYFLFVFIVLGCTILRSATQINHVNRAHVLIGWQLSTQVCQSFTRQIQICEHEKVGEKVGENRDKFYSTPTVCKRVCRLLLCRSHTPNWVCQHEFVNFSLPCEGRLRGVFSRLIFSCRKLNSFTAFQECFPRLLGNMENMVFSISNQANCN